MKQKKTKKNRSGLNERAMTRHSENETDRKKETEETYCFLSFFRYVLWPNPSSVHLLKKERNHTAVSSFFSYMVLNRGRKETKNFPAFENDILLQPLVSASSHCLKT